MTLVSISRRLSRAVQSLSFGAPVSHVYNPLEYARKPHEMYLNRFGGSANEVVFVGMNPGPWGMAQTGVPFGDVSLVREWMGISAAVDKPGREHPKRPVEGFRCPRSEVSGSRFWGWARDRYTTPEAFFARFFVWNYCPLSFMVASGANFTPDKLPADERAPLFTACDAALREIADTLSPRWVVGVGKFAEQRASAALDGRAIEIGTILHPSPASPAANRDWAGKMEAQLRAMGIEL